MQKARDEMMRRARQIMMNELVASIAHEINQPLGAIVSNGQACLRFLAEPTPDIQEVRDALEEMISDAKRASDVLGLIRAQGRSMSSERMPVDINEVVGEVLELTRQERRTYEISATPELDHNLPLVHGDRFQLQQVVLSLITNAIEAMQEAEDRPRVLNVKSELIKQSDVSVTVADNGAGLAKVDLHRIFDAFFTTKAGGTGMGLSICNSIVRAHGGRLSVAPGTPFGAAFSFSLPAIAETA